VLSVRQLIGWVLAPARSSDARRQLIAEAMQSDERHNREVAQRLHDGPLQTLLAAGLRLDEARERLDDPALDAVYAALQEAGAALRSAVTELYPQVLAQLGLAPALRELLGQFASGSGATVEAELEDVGKPESQQLMYRAARELLATVGAGADGVRVSLGRRADRVVLTVTADGPGVQQDDLASLAARVDAMGGSMKLDARPGQHTRVTVICSAEER